MRKSGSFGSNFKLGGIKNIISRGSNLFNTVSKTIDTVTKHPITGIIAKQIPQLTPLISKTNAINERIKGLGNQLEKADRKIQEVESAIKFH